MATWNDGVYRGIQITTDHGRSDNGRTHVKIYGITSEGEENHSVETRAIYIPLDTLKEMVNAQ